MEIYLNDLLVYMISKFAMFLERQFEFLYENENFKDKFMENLEILSSLTL